VEERVPFGPVFAALGEAASSSPMRNGGNAPGKLAVARAAKASSAGVPSRRAGPPVPEGKDKPVLGLGDFRG
jgi:hypothetical protein